MDRSRGTARERKWWNGRQAGRQDGDDATSMSTSTTRARQAFHLAQRRSNVECSYSNRTSTLEGSKSAS